MKLTIYYIFNYYIVIKDLSQFQGLDFMAKKKIAESHLEKLPLDIFPIIDGTVLQYQKLCISPLA